MSDPKNDFSAFPEAGVQSPNANTFDEFPTADKTPSLGTQAGVVAETGARGALESVGVIGGAMAGTQLGAMAAPFAGPLAPAMPVLGGLGGAAYGLWAGGEAASGLGLRTPEQLPPEQRPAGYFGQSLGGSAAFAAAPYAAATSGFRFGGVGMQEGKSMVGNFLNQIIDTAKTHPIVTAVSEASAALSSATGAYLSETFLPGNEAARVNVEMTAGVLNPTRLAVSAAGYGLKLGKQAIMSLSPAGQETAAAKALQEMFRATGEDPTIVARVLRAQGVVGTDQTAAQKSGSMALSAMEDFLTKHSQKFGAEAAQKARDGMDSLRGMITLLSSTGDPAALQAAAQAKSVYFRTLIQGRVDAATDLAQVFARGMTIDTPDARVKISLQARNALDEAISSSRKAEKGMWDKVDGTRRVGFDNLQQTLDEEIAKLLPEVRDQKTPDIVRKFLARVGAPREGEQSLIILPEHLNMVRGKPEPVGTNVGEMRQLRTELLDLARTSTNNGEYGQARIYSDLAESVLDDMDAAFRESGDVAYDEARAFSREFNDVFTRSFAGRATATGRFGDRMAPELMLRKALATGKEAGFIQMQELEEATRFMQIRGLADDTAAKEMMDAQERMFRLAAADTVDPLTGKADPAKIAKFMRDNAALMKRFPEVKRDLQSASMSEAARQRLETLAKGQINIIEKQKAFGKMLASDPVTMASRALLSNTQEKDLVDLINIAKPGYKPRGGVIGVEPQQAIDGLRASVFDAAIRRSTDKNGVLNLEQFRSLLFTPSVPGQKSPIQVLQENKVIDAKQVKNISKLMDAADSISRSQTSGTAVDVNLGLGDAALSTLSRMIGSTVAGAGAKAMGSKTPSLVIHGAGARFAETVLTKLPAKSARAFLMDALNDPEKTAMLLEKVTDPAKAAMQARQIHGWLVQSGLSGTREALGVEEQPQEPVTFFSR
jgi:hypothetical protein